MEKDKEINFENNQKEIKGESKEQNLNKEDVIKNNQKITYNQMEQKQDEPKEMLIEEEPKISNIIPKEEFTVYNSKNINKIKDKKKYKPQDEIKEPEIKQKEKILTDDIKTEINPKIETQLNNEQINLRNNLDKKENEDANGNIHLEISVNTEESDEESFETIAKEDILNSRKIRSLPNKRPEIRMENIDKVFKDIRKIKEKQLKEIQSKNMEIEINDIKSKENQIQEKLNTFPIKENNIQEIKITHKEKEKEEEIKEHQEPSPIKELKEEEHPQIQELPQKEINDESTKEENIKLKENTEINIINDNPPENKKENEPMDLINTKEEEPEKIINNEDIEKKEEINIKNNQQINLDKVKLGMNLSLVKIERQDDINIKGKNNNKNISNIVIPIDYKDIHLLATLSLSVDKVEEAINENKND